MKHERQDYKGRRIEIRSGEDKTELLIDNLPVGYGRLPNGMFFLHNYAYDWTNDLMELARRYVSYRQKVEKVLSGQSAPKER